MKSLANSITACGALLVLIGFAMWIASPGREPRETIPTVIPRKAEPGTYVSIETLRKTAELGVHGAVTSARGVLIDGTPYQEVILTVKKTIVGNPVGQVTVIVYGYEVDGIVSKVLGSPIFTVGQEVVLFLKSWRNAYVITGIQQGLFTVSEEKGRKVAVRDFTGIDFVEPTSLPADGFERLPLETVLGEPPAAPALIQSPSPAEPTRIPSEMARERKWALILIAIGLLAIVGSFIFRRRSGRPSSFTTLSLLAFVAVGWFVLAVLPRVSKAYTPDRVFPSGTVQRWDLTDGTNPRIDVVNVAVRYAIHALGSDNVPNDGEKFAIVSAAKTWSNLDYCAFRWTRVADDTRPIGSQTSADGQNTVYWLEASTIDAGHGFDISGHLAATVIVSGNGGKMVDTDIIFNGVGYTWSTTGAQGTNDVRCVATHEFGHALGLNHSAHQAATMIPYAPSFDQKSAYTLTEDDMIGARSLYPKPTFQTMTGKIQGTLTTSSGVNVHEGIVLARRQSDGVVAAAVLSTNGNYVIEGLAPGDYLLQTQAIGRTYFDLKSKFGPFLAVGATQNVISVAADDVQVIVSLGQTTNTPLVMSDGWLGGLQIGGIHTKMPGASLWRDTNGPILLGRGLTGVLIGFSGANMPTAASQVASINFGTTMVTVASGPLFLPNKVYWSVNISPTATPGPRNIEMSLTDGRRIIFVGGLEIRPGVVQADPIVIKEK